MTQDITIVSQRKNSGHSNREFSEFSKKIKVASIKMLYFLSGCLYSDRNWSCIFQYMKLSLRWPDPSSQRLHLCNNNQHKDAIPVCRGMRTHKTGFMDEEQWEDNGPERVPEKQRWKNCSPLIFDLLESAIEASSGLIPFISIYMLCCFRNLFSYSAESTLYFTIILTKWPILHHLWETISMIVRGLNEVLSHQDVNVHSIYCYMCFAFDHLNM